MEAGSESYLEKTFTELLHLIVLTSHEAALLEGPPHKTLLD